MDQEATSEDVRTLATSARPLDRFLDDPTHPLPPKPPDAPGPPPAAPADPLAPLVEAYISDLAKVRARLTIAHERYDLRAILRAAAEEALPADLGRWTEADVLALKARWEHLAPSTQKARMKALGTFLAFHGNDVVLDARRRGRLPLPPVTHGPVHVIDETARRRLFAAARPTLRMALVLGFGLGLRLGELAAVRVDDFHDGTLVVRRGKGGKARTVPVGPDVEREVRAYVEGHRARLISRARAAARRRGGGGAGGGADDSVDPGVLLVHMFKGAARHYDRAALGGSLRGLGRRAGVRFSPHDMRRTFATELADMGAGLDAVGEVLGHEDADTTRRYVMVRPERLRAGTRAHQVAICEELARARGTDGHPAGMSCSDHVNGPEGPMGCAGVDVMVCHPARSTNKAFSDVTQ